MRTVLFGIVAALDTAACAHAQGPERSAPPARPTPPGSNPTAIGAQAGAAAVPPTPAEREGTTGASAAPLQDEAIRALLSDVSVTVGRTALLDDGPAEIFWARGIYQRVRGRGSALGVPFEIRDNAVCVPNGASTPLCRRIRPNGDGTYTFIDTADGTAAVMTITPMR